MQIKTTMRYHYTHVRIAKTQTETFTNAGENIKQQELLFITGGNAK